MLSVCNCVFNVFDGYLPRNVARPLFHPELIQIRNTPEGVVWAEILRH